MADATVKTPLQYLDKAMGSLRDLGLFKETKPEDAPIIGLLEKISELEPDKIAVISRTLGQMSTFNEIVREQISEMTIGQRYEEITKQFNSIRDDAKAMVDQISDGKIDVFERATNAWMKIARGDIATRFDKIRDTYVAVAKDTKTNIEREHIILEAYMDFRGALKQAEVSALEVLKTAEGRLDKAKAELATAADAVKAYAGDDAAERARLELARDEKLRAMQAEDGRYQIAKDLADNLTIGYNTSEVIMARLTQTTSAKERVYQQAVSFFTTNESVLTALKASFTGMFGLHEIDRDAQPDEGRRLEIDRRARRDRRQDPGRGAEGGLWPDHPRRRRQEAGQLGRHLPGALGRDHRRDADARHQELRGNPRGGRGRQAAHGAPRRRGERADRQWLTPRPRRRPRRRRQSSTT